MNGYVVIMSAGQYSDHWEQNIKVFLDEDKAKALVATLEAGRDKCVAEWNKLMSELDEKYPRWSKGRTWDEHMATLWGEGYVIAKQQYDKVSAEITATLCIDDFNGYNSWPDESMEFRYEPIEIN